ncbi:MAG TPA: toprim domain-containing protein [Candidatus Paceibacterota bacterium]
MDSIRRLEEMFAHFPGIGPRQAKRFVYYLQSRSSGTIKELTDLIKEVRSATAECASCHRFFMDDSSGSHLCRICSDGERDQTTLMVVARDSDFETIEKSGAYKGLYFILGGTVPILDKEPEKRIRLRLLADRVIKQKPSEVILSLNATPEGENTAQVVVKTLRAASSGLNITMLGRGLSTGAELEYVDADTIKNALTNRK